MHEIVPGVVWWKAPHHNIGSDVSSYLLAERGVLLNPILPPDGLEPIEQGPRRPADIVMTNRHHVRDIPRFVEAFGCAVHTPAVGLEEVRDQGIEARGYAPGEELPGGLVAREVGVISPDEMAVHIPWAGAVALADGVIRRDDGPLQFVPDFLLGDDPEAVKAGLLDAFERLAGELEPEHLLLAHGDPWVGGGADALRDFVTRSR